MIRISGAYTAGHVLGDTRKCSKNIPAEDLAIQWDICMEMLAVDVNDDHSVLFPWKPRRRGHGTVRR